jgi:hypothetical protein
MAARRTSATLQVNIGNGGLVSNVAASYRSRHSASLTRLLAAHRWPTFTACRPNVSSGPDTWAKQYICSPMCRLTSGSRSNLLSWIKLPSKTTDNAGLEQPQGAASIRGIEQHRLSCLRPRHLETSNTAIHRAAKMFQFFHGDCDDREAKQSRSNSEIT